jgi:hypothetical protein
MVVSDAVPAVLGIATIGTLGFAVAATPSSDRTSSNSGLAAMIPTALHVSCGEPPPTAISTSAPASRNAARPARTFSIGGFGATSENTS